MADPLSTIAEEFAPAPTSYFDKGQAQTLISRYGNANRGAASSKRLADTALQSHQLDRSMADEQRRADKDARDAILMSREDIDYGEKKLADETRSGFIKKVMEELDPTKDSFDNDVVGFMQGLPPSILRDQTLMDVVKIKSKQADEAKAARRDTDEINLRQKNNLALVEARAKYNPILANLTSEDNKEAPIDVETGKPDPMWLMQRAMERKNAKDLEMDKAKKGNTVDAAIKLYDRKSLNAAQKALYDETEKILINDEEAFPSEVERFRRKHSKDGTTADKRVLEGKPGYAEAVEWDKKKFEKEVLAAQDKTEDAYVDMKGMENISDAAKNRRTRLWEYAHQNDGKAPQAETVKETEAPKQEAPKQEAPKQEAPKQEAPKQEAPKQEAAPTVRVVGDRIQITYPNGRVFNAPNTPEMLKKIQGGE